MCVFSFSCCNLHRTTLQRAQLYSVPQCQTLLVSSEGCLKTHTLSQVKDNTRPYCWVATVTNSCCVQNLRAWLSFFTLLNSCLASILAVATHCVLMQSWGAGAIKRELCQEMCLGWGRYYPPRTCEDLDLLRKLITRIIIQGILKWSVLIGCVCVCVCVSVVSL